MHGVSTHIAFERCNTMLLLSNLQRHCAAACLCSKSPLSTPLTVSLAELAVITVASAAVATQEVARLTEVHVAALDHLFDLCVEHPCVLMYVPCWVRQ
jgi:hypothetical protein